MQEEDDKPTVVLDFSALKDQLNNEEELTDQSEIDSLFASEFKDIEPLEEPSFNKTEEFKQNLYLFEYQSDYFKKAMPLYMNNKHMHLIESVDQLNKALEQDPTAIILFYYNANPKAVNLLTAQIRAKFKEAKAIIIAKNLSAAKVEMHSKTKYAAHSYLNDPFNINDLYQTIEFIGK